MATPKVSIDFTTPVGRLLQGSILKPNTTDRKTGKPLVVKTGPNAGQPATQYYSAIGFAKLVNGQPNPDWQRFYGELYNAARQFFPHLFTGPGGGCVNPRFAFKITDGDGVDADGKPNNVKPGWAGHWVLKLGTMIAPKLIDQQGNLIVDPNYVKAGYYVRAFGSFSDNTPADVPGIYVNGNGYQFCGYGEEISQGMDVAAAAQAAGAFVLPAGASATPLAPSGAVPALGSPPGATPPQLPGLTPPGAGMAPPPVPNTAFVNNALGGPPLTLPGAAPALALPVRQPVYMPTHLAQGAPLEQWLQGHTIEQLVAAGVFTQG